LFAELDLDFGISAPKEIATDIETRLAQEGDKIDHHDRLALWRLAARAYRYAERPEDQHRCQNSAADCLVEEAERSAAGQPSAVMAASLLSDAIAELHGVPGAKDKRRALRHRLVDVQAGIPDEMGTFSHPIDLRPLVENAERSLEGLNLRDMLLMFADLEGSPAPEKLREEAIRSIQKHPLSSLFGTTFHDHEGKVLHRTSGGGIGDGQDEEAIQTTVAQHEKIRREIHARGQVEAGRRYIVDRFYLAEDIFRSLLGYSPFVPNDLVQTFSRGFTRFFQGDFVAGLYILTPLLENSLRHVLKMNGLDVTTFDDARQVQEERTLSGLFEQMRSELDEVFTPAITTDVANVFLSQPGPCIRNNVAHGLLHDGDPYSSDAIYACWLIFRLCCIPLFGKREQIVLAVG
jgi:hypothetical protein